MTYIDNTARPKMKADLVDYYQGKPIPLALTLKTLPPPWGDDPLGKSAVASLNAATQ
jgi:hypothetical protein